MLVLQPTLEMWRPGVGAGGGIEEFRERGPFFFNVSDCELQWNIFVIVVVVTVKEPGIETEKNKRKGRKILCSKNCIQYFAGIVSFYPPIILWNKNTFYAHLWWERWWSDRQSNLSKVTCLVRTETELNGFVYYRTHSKMSKHPLVLRLYYIMENFISLIIYDRFIGHMKLLNI